MSEPENDAGAVLVIGATGHLGRKISHLARRRGCRVHALVREALDAAALRRLGIDVVPGNLLDRPSPDAAMRGCRAVVATVIGYANRKRGDFRSEAETIGCQLVGEAISAFRVRRLVFGSVPTCDRATRSKFRRGEVAE